MPREYDNRITSARGNTTFVFARSNFAPHHLPVESSHKFLERLKAAGVTQGDMGKVLGIAQSNAATFYTPGKNGKLRTLKWDEGAKLAEAFNIQPPGEESEPETAYEWPNADMLAPLLDALLPLVPKTGATEKSVEALSEGLAYGLQLLGEPGASSTSADALRVAARGATARFRDLLLQ